MTLQPQHPSQSKLQDIAALKNAIRQREDGQRAAVSYIDMLEGEISVKEKEVYGTVLLRQVFNYCLDRLVHRGVTRTELGMTTLTVSPDEAALLNNTSSANVMPHIEVMEAIDILLDEIDESQTGEARKNDWTESTKKFLISVHETIDKTQRVSVKQAEAINNIRTALHRNCDPQ